MKDRLGELLDRLRQEADGRDGIVRIVLEGRSEIHERLRKGRALQELIDELREEELDRGCFVWIESIEDRTASELDLTASLEEKSFLGDLLRYGAALQSDDAALESFAGEALAALQSLPQSAGNPAAASPEQLREWLRSAEVLVADLLTADGGGPG